MSKLNDLYRIWIEDILFCPYKSFCRKFINIRHRYRTPVISEITYICIHEWGGYPMKRSKSIKNIVPFDCGLESQLNRYSRYRASNKVNLTITMSESEKNIDLNMLKNQCENFIPVCNVGMDFSGYNAFYQFIKNKPNSYVILTNSSVNTNSSNDFLDGYINYLNENPDIGLLGISCSSKYYHTLLRWNFNPHVQSFFLMTTIDVLNEIVEWNNGTFPGINETNKHLLIRNGEVRITKAVLKLGYNAAVVLPSGPIKFNYKNYPLPKGDYRNYTDFPNQIFNI